MSLLQNPVLVLEQIDWFLSNRDQEKFPSSYLLAAGNLSRQLLEQVLFILAFYGELPANRYMKSNKRLRVANDILTALRASEPSTGLSYFEKARRRGPRIAKFANLESHLDRWRDILNEPSHFLNPAMNRRTQHRHIAAFAKRLRRIVDLRDWYLIIAAVNEIRSGGVIKAVLKPDKHNTPGVHYDSVVTPRDLCREDGKLALKTRSKPIRFLRADQEVPLRWSKIILLVQGCVGMSINTQFKTKDGYPVNLKNFQTIISSLCGSEADRKLIDRQMKKLGYTIAWTFGEPDSNEPTKEWIGRSKLCLEMGN